MKQNGASDVLARLVAVKALVIGHRRGRYLAVLVYLRAALQLLFETAAIPLRIWPRLLFGGFVFFS